MTKMLVALRSYEQADEDGVMVLVSRQAVDEAASEIERLRLALTRVSEGFGAFSTDPLTHAKNCIEEMRQIALDALSTEQPAD